MKWKKAILLILTILSRLRLPEQRVCRKDRNWGTVASPTAAAPETAPAGAPPCMTDSSSQRSVRDVARTMGRPSLDEAPTVGPRSAADAAQPPFVTVRRPPAVGASSSSACFAPSSRSQGLSLLASDCRASTRAIELLVLHCSATWPSVDYSIEKLMRDHKARGFGDYPGYHIYVRRDGTIYYCRPIRLKGCHVRNFNARSIGVCFEGGLSQSLPHRPEDTRTAEQLVALHEVLSLLVACYPEARIVGHNELAAGKDCPCLFTKASHEYQYLLR